MPTDVHLNFDPWSRLDALRRVVRVPGADAVPLGGDIAEAPDVPEPLTNLEGRFGLPVSFVPGNHVDYRGGVARVRATR